MEICLILFTTFLFEISEKIQIWTGNYLSPHRATVSHHPFHQSPIKNKNGTTQASSPLTKPQGKRKKAAKRPTGKKKLEPLPTQFACLFCNHEDSVVCKLDKVHRIGNLVCKVCGQSHQCVINSFPIVFWLW